MRKSIESLRNSLEQARQKLQSFNQKLEAKDPVEFARTILDIEPTDYQAKALMDNSKLVSLLWSRQSGKTLTVSILILWTALTNASSQIGIVSPSLRQSKAVLRRIATLVRRLPRGWAKEVQKTKVELWNGSIIEAYPNNPDTIRGPSLKMVYCDEMGFIRDDDELYNAIIFTLSTVHGGRFIVSSTPGSKDNLFYKFCTDLSYKFSVHHVSWRDAVEPNGPLKLDMLETIRQQLAGDPWRWRREMEAEFVDDDQSFFPRSLITKTVDETLEYTEHSEYVLNKDLYLGIDPGKHHDPSAVGIVEYDRASRQTRLIHLQVFPLETQYAMVIGYVKQLTQHWKEIRRIMVDTTGLGDVVLENMKNEGLNQAVPVNLSIQSKQDILENLHQMMSEKKLNIPYDTKLINELNGEKYEINKAGRIQFSHPDEMHDDRLWALALACWGLKQDTRVPDYHPVFQTGRVSEPIHDYARRRERFMQEALANRNKPPQPNTIACLICWYKRPLAVPVCPRCNGNPGWRKYSTS